MINIPHILSRNIKLATKKRFLLQNVTVLHKYVYSTNILGIETSCDDTGCAIINDNGDILSETLYSQNLIHLRNGGIVPDVAQDLHRSYIEPVVNETIKNSKLSMDRIAALAVTVKPGLPLSLAVGLKYAKYLARKYNKPIIPIHHMQAHALITRMNNNISFPFLVLLISGGHCLLAIVQDINHFLLLGQSIDSAPGEVLDKVARRMKLKNITEYSKICGGQAIELAASKSTNPLIFSFPLPLADYKDCNFSFNGLKTSVLTKLHKKEREHNIIADELIPEVNDLCAAMLMAISKHLVHRTQRAMEFCRQNNLIPQHNKQLVVSGGVACNNFIYNSLKVLCDQTEYTIYRPAPKLCTDNGIMIAWNGLEKWKESLDIMTNYNKLDIEARSPIGESLIENVIKAKIPIKVIKLTQNK